ncbi:hypothetical protein DH09_04145 [Bacillaceae bacterium JMAK1]|nr:hypothetical protein DH09_04145 [Bacillaceae bacterium JMAK1]
MNTKRIVIKIGSSSLAKRDGGIAHERIVHYSRAIGQLHQLGYEIILISSGAVAAGFQKIGYRTRPTTTAKKQAAAAVGQGLLMEAYEKAFLKQSIAVAQLLLTRSTFSHEEQYNNAYQTLAELLKRRVIPIINENDSIAIEELTFGDNDWLSSLVAGLLNADQLLLLTDVDGVYNAHPSQPDAKRIERLNVITDSFINEMDDKRSSLGTGGMKSKLEAAKRAQSLGINTFIGRAESEDELIQAVKGNGKGTYVERQLTTWTKNHQWVGIHSEIEGRIMIDDGAKDAMLYRGKSLLAVGIKKIEASFEKGAIIAVYDRDGLLVGKGRSALSSNELETANETSLVCIHRDHWVSHQKGRMIDESNKTTSHRL